MDKKFDIEKYEIIDDLYKNLEIGWMGEAIYTNNDGEEINVIIRKYSEQDYILHKENLKKELEFLN